MDGFGPVSGSAGSWGTAPVSVLWSSLDPFVLATGTICCSLGLPVSPRRRRGSLELVWGAGCKVTICPLASKPRIGFGDRLGSLMVAGGMLETWLGALSSR